MRPIYAVHILAGSLALLSGFVALYATKGARVHRKVGMVFVFAMVTMCVGGALLAVLRFQIWSVINLSAALLTGYLVLTSLLTVRPLATRSRWLDAGLMLVASTISFLTLPLGFQAIAAGGTWNGIPAFPFFLFGIVGLFATVGDFRVIRSGALQGAKRLTRHLWRMSFALFIASMSFFFGQAKVIPEPIRIYPLLAVPVVAVLVTMLYWMWRVRRRPSAVSRQTLNIGRQPMEANG